MKKLTPENYEESTEEGKSVIKSLTLLQASTGLE
jgi:hypothetical protein